MARRPLMSALAHSGLEAQHAAVFAVGDVDCAVLPHEDAVGRLRLNSPYRHPRFYAAEGDFSF